MSATKPLYKTVERLFGKNSLGPGYSEPFATIFQIRQQMRRTDSRLALSRSDERAFWIIWEWWAAYAPFCEVDAESAPTEYVRYFVASRAYEFTVQSIEFLDMFHHFHRECGGEDIPGERLELYRQSVAATFACQQVSLQSLRHHATRAKSPLPRQVDPMFKAYAQYTNVLPRSRIGRDDPPGLSARCTTGASISSCDWLQESTELPFYLWDIAARRTVEVKDLVDRPTYVAISHTWGRWRKAGVASRVPGCNSWAVPENSMFDVQLLPEILAAFPVDVPFVWFDLVCIPQDDSPLAQIEIARQAEIFKNAKHAMIWLNTVDSWTGFSLALEIMAIEILGVEAWEEGCDWMPDEDVATKLFDPYEYRTDATMVVNPWFSSLWTLQEICLRPDMWLCNKNMELFTVGGGSLPAAFNTATAVVRRWQVRKRDFAVMNEDPNPPRLDLVTQKVSASNKFTALIGRKGFRRGCLELCELLDRTGMEDLQDIQRDQILLLGSARYCLKNRADAIMSVLGVFRWRDNFVPDDPRHLVQHCVLGQYPLEFVKEVADNQGGSFFGSLSSYGRSITEVLQPTADAAVRGSLLPFLRSQRAQSGETRYMMEPWFRAKSEDDTLKSWIVQQDGSVHIIDAAVLTSTQDPRPGALWAVAWMTYDDEWPIDSRMQRGSRLDYGEVRNYEDDRFVSVNLRQWAKDYFPATGNYAVKTGKVDAESRGILLKELGDGSNRMFKVGNFITSSSLQLPGPSIDAVLQRFDRIVL